MASAGSVGTVKPAHAAVLRHPAPGCCPGTPRRACVRACVCAPFTAHFFQSDTFPFALFPFVLLPFILLSFIHSLLYLLSVCWPHTSGRCSPEQGLY